MALHAVHVHTCSLWNPFCYATHAMCDCIQYLSSHP